MASTMNRIVGIYFAKENLFPESIFKNLEEVVKASKEVNFSLECWQNHAGQENSDVQFRNDCIIARKRNNLEFFEAFLSNYLEG